MHHLVCIHTSRHHFKLNKHESFGGAISDKTVGAFASMNEVDVAELYTIIYTLLKPAQMRTYEDFFMNYDGMSKFYTDNYF